MRLATILPLALAIAGCKGDFGRVHPVLVRDDIHAWLGSEATQGQRSPLPLTSDERLLRDLGYPLIVQPYRRERFDAIVHEYGLTTPYQRGRYDRNAYAGHLLSTWRATPLSAYAQLIDDVRNDITRVPQFYAVAARVRDVDERRRKSLFFVSAVGEGERSAALARIDENAAIIDWVHETLTERAASYRIALERLVVAAPDRQAADAERLIGDLQKQAAYYSRHLPAPYVRERSLAATR